jgi:hypothetical protein
LLWLPEQLEYHNRDGTTHSGDPRRPKPFQALRLSKTAPFLYSSWASYLDFVDACQKGSFVRGFQARIKPRFDTVVAEFTGAPWNVFWIRMLASSTRRKLLCVAHLDRKADGQSRNWGIAEGTVTDSRTNE